jgi:hypothetical protein
VDDVTGAARRFRDEARRRGSPARATLARRYAQVAAGVRRDALDLGRAVAAMRAGGMEPTAELVAALRETHELRARTNARLVTVADGVLDLLDRETAREVRHALRDARALVRLRDRSRTLAQLIDETSVLNMVGVTERGPLRELLVARAGRDADAVARVLVDGMVRGRTTQAMAADVSGLITHGSHADALRIVRTETHRARREAARITYLRTPGVVGWRWVCSLTSRSCGLCWGMHGQVLPLNQPMPTHPNCSCELAPVWAGEETDPGELGTALFDALTPAEQDQAIGAAAARAYRAGAITLPDLARTGRSPQWGPTGRQASLREVLGDRAQDFYRAG